ncbi:F-box only protein 50-like [Notolabrus celidotus]|uniref:F-box only protein 50-like n=1 Tax=Notolabrus celidotus TaxID=1203425 RepID=UPI0014901BA0|nr:F-box only protein 50-like [Notolabrus celidotus]
MAEWKKKCEVEWGLQGAPMPDGLDWKSTYEAKPLGRNLLKNPSPHGVSKDEPESDESAMDQRPMRGPIRFAPEGDFIGWTTSTETIPEDRSGIPEGVVICSSSRYSWFSLVQVVDLKAEGLWDELLDKFQPEIVIQDWYQDSQLQEQVYELHVKLLGADKSKVISERSILPTEDRNAESKTWKEVSHVFSGYGPGVRYVHFQHRLKNMSMDGMVRGFYETKSSDSSVIVKPTKTSS